MSADDTALHALVPLIQKDLAGTRKHGSKERRWTTLPLPGAHHLRSRMCEMKTLALVLAIIFAAGMSWADDGDAPLKPPPFRPWQEVWQCNDVRVTVTSRSPEEIEYDLGGMIWGGSRFTVVRGNLFFNGRPCVPLRPVGY
jgi:hypothetical protein